MEKNQIAYFSKPVASSVPNVLSLDNSDSLKTNILIGENVFP